MDNNSLDRFNIQTILEFKRFQDANLQNPNIDSRQAILMYGRAIHWVGILDVIWPDFDQLDHYSVEVAYIVPNDPDKTSLSPAFYQYIAQRIAMFWKLQLQQSYPAGNWSVAIDDDPEITVWAEIHSRK
jgi:hypothetical protein